MPLNRKPASRRRQGGNAILEFALVLVFLVPLFLGSVLVGLTLNRGIQASQLCRDVGHMFIDDIDFSLPNNQKIVGRLAYGMGLAVDATGTIDPSGKGVVILSQVIHIGLSECLAGGHTGTWDCPNYDQLALEKRIVIGNSSLHASALGTPGSAIVQGDGSISPSDYTTDPSAAVPGVSSIGALALPRGQFTYATETYFITPELAGFSNALGGVHLPLNATYSFNFF